MHAVEDERERGEGVPSCGCRGLKVSAPLLSCSPFLNFQQIKHVFTLSCFLLLLIPVNLARILTVIESTKNFFWTDLVLYLRVFLTDNYIC